MVETLTREYRIHSEAWYAKSSPLRDGCLEEITVGIYSSEGGTTGEFMMRWYDISGLSPRLEAYHDSWDVLHEVDLVPLLAENDHQVSPKEFCAMLEGIGFVDATGRESPFRHPPCCKECGRPLEQHNA